MNRRTEPPHRGGGHDPGRRLRQHGQPHRAPASPARPPSLATSLATATGTWAVAVMGGSAASHNNFWQLFVRPAGTSPGSWPPRQEWPATAAWSSPACQQGSVLAGFRPSQDLSYSPLATTKDNGTSWSPGLLDAALADVPGALAADPASGRLLALLANGTTDISGPGGTAWTPLVTRRALAATPADTRCHLVSLTAATFGPSGQSHAGCWLRPSRNRRDLLPHRRNLAANRPYAPCRLRAPGHHRAPAHHLRRRPLRPC